MMHENEKAGFPREIRLFVYRCERTRSDGNGWMTQAVAASLSFFIGRTLTFTVAGLAAKVVS